MGKKAKTLRKKKKHSSQAKQWSIDAGGSLFYMSFLLCT